MDNIKVESTTDSQAEIDAALGKQVVEETKSVPSKNEDESEQSQDESDTSKQDDESESESEDDESKEESESDDEDKKPRKKNGFKKRVDRLNRKLSEKDAEIERLRRQYESGAPKKDEAPAKEETKSNAKPRPQEFDTHEEYVEALTDYKIAQKEEQYERQSKEAESKRESEKQFQTFQSKVNDFKKEASDFDDVVYEVDDIPLTPLIQKAILTSDIGPQLMYELAKDRERLEKIISLDQFTALKEIGKIEDRIEQRLSSKKQSKQTTTKAPPPITPLNSKTSAKVSKNPDEMSFDEYKAYRAGKK